jgi:prepilin-type N-terminal cleavage/methylation domain-containing protein
VPIRLARAQIKNQKSKIKNRAGFTLIEVMLALAIAAIVLTAINAVFFGALRLRSTTVAVAEQALPVERAVETIKNDLVCIRPPSTNGFIGPMGTDATAVGMSQPLILELYTSSAHVSDDVPWADIQKIDYWLQSPTNATRGATGKDLIRGITRNLLASTPEAPEPHRLLGNVQNLRLSYFDGTNWNDTWSVQLSNVPQAIKVFLTFSAPADGTPATPPFQFVVPVITQLSSNM